MRKGENEGISWPTRGSAQPCPQTASILRTTAVSHSPGGGVGLPEQNNAIRDSDHVLELFREPIGDCGGTARRAHQARMRRLPLLT